MERGKAPLSSRILSNLAPALGRRDIVIMDKLPAHKVANHKPRVLHYRPRTSWANPIIISEARTRSTPTAGRELV